jgi:hypothetical protein
VPDGRGVGRGQEGGLLGAVPLGGLDQDRQLRQALAGSSRPPSRATGLLWIGWRSMLTSETGPLQGLVNDHPNAARPCYIAMPPLGEMICPVV